MSNNAHNKRKHDTTRCNKTQHKRKSIKRVQHDSTQVQHEYKMT